MKDEHIVAKGHVYICPFCNGESVSNTKTGQIDHRSVCGKQFYVKEGRASGGAKAYVYTCPLCSKETLSNTKTGQAILCEGGPRQQRDAEPCPLMPGVSHRCVVITFVRGDSREA